MKKQLPQADLDFLLEVLKVIANNIRKPQVVYPLLQENLERLNDDFAQVLRIWATVILAKAKLRQAAGIAEVIVIFSNQLTEFPLGNKASKLEIAIVGYKVSATVLTQQYSPDHWAVIQNSLGLAHSNSAKRGERADNLELAIKFYSTALEIYTRKAFPQKWAIIQNNLGSAYCERIKGKRAENLEVAIRFHLAALEIFDRENFPHDWANTQNFLGVAYSQQIQGDRAENQEKSILAYQAALQIFTCEALSQRWAEIQNNLGTLYCERLNGESSDNLELAISCFKAALQVLNQQNSPENWALAQSNLGCAYFKRTKGDGAENQELAIESLQAALSVYTREIFPQQWAETKNNLGGVYWNRIKGNGDDNLQQAIDAYIDALEIFTYEAFPQRWATTQNNLGMAYLWAGQVDEAIACFRLNLKVYKHNEFPKDCLMAGRNLGIVSEVSKRWIEAIEGYGVAIEAVEYNRTLAGTNQRQQEILSESIGVYAKVVEACIKVGDLAKAIEYVERSKARNLVETLANRDFHPKGNIPETVLQDLKRLRREIVAEQRHLDILEQNRLHNIELDMGKQTEGSTAWLLERNKLKGLFRHLDDLIAKEIDPVDPTFRATQQVKPISCNEIKEILDDRIAVIEWYISLDEFHTFIVTNQSEQPQVWSSSAEEKQALIEWLEEYLQDYQQNRKQWIQKLSDRLYRLSEILHIDDIINSLPSNCDQIILIPHRFLHLIPLHALSLSEGDYLLDRFPRGVRYAPSCQLLQLTQNQDRSNFEHFLAIQNPTKDLGYTTVEVGTIQHYFSHADVFVENAAKKATLVQVKTKDDGTREVIQNSQLSLANCAHFSCHGEFNFESPLDAALLLADGERLTLGEIFDLDLSQCRLVTLSACETGLTNYKILSDEYVGIPSSFLYAGSPSVVSSLWAVQDVSTAFLMIKFYQKLPLSETVAIALNQAQLWLRNLTKKELQEWISENKISLDATLNISLRRRLHKISDNEQPFKSPFHWAAFCAIGQ